MSVDPRLRPAIVGGAILLLVVGAVIGTVVIGPMSPTPTPGVSASPTVTPSASPTLSPSPLPTPAPAARCPYDGLPLANDGALDRTAILVQVENNPIGRPTSGLNAADLVIEAPVEGDTTRFGAVYLCGRAPEAIGPIRSARYYNTDLWRQLHLVTLHFGAGYAILREFNREGTPYVNGISGGWGFFERRASPPAPHNVFLDLAQARHAAEDGAFGERIDRAGTPGSVFRFNPAVTLPDGGRAVGAVRIHTNSFWNFGWRWDAASGWWLRRDDGVEHVDALTGEPLSATSVVVQFVNQTILDEYDPGGYPRRRQHLVGRGEGILYVDGRAHDIRWSRQAAGAATEFTYASGERVVLPPGRVWWEIVPVGSPVDER